MVSVAMFSKTFTFQRYILEYLQTDYIMPKICFKIIVCV